MRLHSRLLACLGLLLLAGCDDSRTPQQQAQVAAGQPMQIEMPQPEATTGSLNFYRVRIPARGGIGATELWVITGATVSYTEGCGKNCTRRVSVDTTAPPPMTTEALAALARISPEDRRALGLPDIAAVRR